MWWIPLALADSLGPCTTAALIVIISHAIVKRKNVLLISFSYILGLLTGYILLGMAAYWGFQLLSPAIMRHLVYMLTFIIVLLALKNIYSAYRDYVGEKEEECVVCDKKTLLNRATHPMIGLLVGFLFSFTLLPCSMGPYIAFITKLSMIGGSPLLIIFYNLVFGWIYYAIALSSYLLTSTSFIEKWLYRYSYVFSAFSGLILLVFSVWIIKTV